jgi:putative transposase
MRKVEFINGEYYHIYNRGVDKRNIFVDDFDYLRFLKSIKEFNNIDPIGSLYQKSFEDKKTSKNIKDTPCPIGHGVSKALVEFIAYCLNPNHYHFIIRQIEVKGIEKFMHKLSMGYAKYFNHKNKRSGSLFQGPFKSAHIKTNEKLLLLSAYVNCNHFIHGLGEKNWKYSSHLDYIGKRDGKLCEKKIILGQFNNSFLEYEKYLRDNGEYLKEEKEYILE